jgi:thioredoxin reductase (NADPH)
MNSQLYDYIVIGAGAAGLASGQYGARSGMKTLIIDQSAAGGQALQITNLENYPGIFPAVSGAEFSTIMKHQAESFGAEIIQTQITSIDKTGSRFMVKTGDGTFLSYAVLLATGAEHKTLGIPGEKELAGSGVSYCAVCDGPFFKDKCIFVVGGGDSACDEASFLATLSPHVTLVHRRGQLRAQKAVADKLIANGNISIRYNSVIKEIRGQNHVESVLIADSEDGTETEFPADAVFIFAGMSPRTELFPILPVDEAGYIITNNKMETGIQGLYCAGDVRSKPIRQLVTAVADGAVAAFQAEKYVSKAKHANTGVCR